MADMLSIKRLDRHWINIDGRNAEIKGSCCIGYAKVGTVRENVFHGTKIRTGFPPGFPSGSRTVELIPESYLYEITLFFKQWINEQEWGKEIRSVSVRGDDSRSQIEFKVCL